MLPFNKEKEHSISGEGTRTPDRTDMSRLLYHLSYAANFVVFNRRHYIGQTVFVSSTMMKISWRTRDCESIYPVALRLIFFPYHHKTDSPV